jgi:hypothetical protein
MVLSWLGAVVLFALGDLALNNFLYGGGFTTGYPSGLITFSASAILPNLERMPRQLVESMPMLLLALGSLVWIVIRLAQSRGVERGHHGRARARRDGVVALVLFSGWLSVWGLYATYTWTVGQTLGTVIPIHVVRFYVPALGVIALLAAWFLIQLPRWLAIVVLALLTGAGVWSFQLPANHVIVRPRYGPGKPRSGVNRGAPVPLS